MGLNDYVAKITLRAEDTASSVVSGLTSRVDALQNSLSRASSSVTSAASSLASVGRAGASTKEALDGAAGGAGAASSAFSLLSGTTGILVGGMAALAGAVGLGVSGGLFRSLVEDGIEFNKTLEGTRTGIGAMLYGTREWTTVAGEATSAQDRMTVAFALAENTQRKLVDAAAATGLSYEGLLDGFQAAYGPALAKGVTNLDQLVRITTSASIATNALGLDTRMLKQEMRAIFEGRQGPYDSLNRALGITAKELAEAKKSAEGVGGYLEKKLAPFLEMNAASAGNLSLVVSRLKTEWAEFAGEVSRPIFDKLKEVLGDVSGRLSPFQSDLSDIAARFVVLFDQIVPTAEAFARFGIEVLDISTNLIPLVGTLLGVVASLVGGLADLTGGWGEEIIALGLAYIAFGKLHAALTSVVGWLGLTTTAQGVNAIATFSLSGAWAALEAKVFAGTAAFIASTTAIGATTAGMALMTGGLIAAALAVGALIVVWTQYREEQAKVAASYGGLRDTMIQNLDAMVKKHPELEARMQGLRERIEATDRTNLAALDRLHDEYTKVAHSAKKLGEMKVAAGEAAVRVTDKEKAATEMAGEAAEKAAEKAQKLREEYDETLRKINSAKENTGLSGLELRITQIAQKWDSELAKIRTKFGEHSDLLKKAEEAKNLEIERAEADWWERIKKVAEDKGRSYLAIVVKTADGTWKAWEKAVQKLPAAIQTAYVAAAAIPFALPKKWEVGVATGLERIRRGIDDWSTTISNVVTSAWNAMARAFDEAFYSVLTGDLDNLKDVFKSFGESILKTLSQAFSDILQRWLLTKLGIEQNPATGGFKFGDNGAFTAGGGFSAGNTIVGAGVGYGVGSIVGGGGAGNQIGGSIGGAAGAALAGTKLGASVLSWAGPFGVIVGAVVGAIIGAIIGGLFNKNTEKKVYFDGSDVSSRNRNEGWGSILSTADTMSNSFYRMTKEAGRTDLMGWWKEKQKDVLDSMNVKVHAGSDEHLQADFEALVTKYVPRWTLKEMFGMRTTGKHPDLPGVTGIPEFAPWSPQSEYDAPIPNLLKSLGFSAEKMKEIADQIDVMDPLKFMSWLEALVSLAVGFKAAAGKVGQSGADMWAEAAKRNGATALEGFTDSAANLKTLAAELSNYSGDEQIEKARELINLTNQHYENQIAYVQKLVALSERIKASVADQIEGMGLDMMSNGQKRAYFKTKLESLYGELGTASTPEEIERLMAQIQGASGSLWGLVKDDINAGSWKEWLSNVLNNSATIADTKLKEMADAIAATNEGLQTAMDNARALFTGVNEVTATTKDEVEDFGDKVEDAGDDVEALGASARAASAAIDHLVALGAAAAAATAALSGITGGGVRSAVTPDGGGTVAAIRRNPGSIVSRTA